MLYTTLQYSGVEKSLADWGIGSWSRNVQNQANDNFTLSIPTPMDGSDVFPYGSQIVIRINRTTSTVNPLNPTLPQSGATSFTGGTQWFVGYCVDNDRVGNPGEESFNYKFAGPYTFFFERLVFQKLQLTWNNNPATGSPRNFADYQSDVILGLSLTTLTGPGDTVEDSTATNLMSFAQQIKEICLFAQAASAAAYGSPQFQCDQLTTEVDGINWDMLDTPSANVLVKDFYGTPLSGKTSAVLSSLLAAPGTVPAYPGTYILRPPLDAVNAVTCKEAMQRLLQSLGGIGSPQVWVDHSQTPPQLHIATPDLIATADPGTTTTAQRMGGGFILNLPLTGRTVKARIKARYDLLPAAAHFKYKVNGSILGAQDDVVINDVAAYLVTATGAVGTPGAAGVALYEGIGTIGSLYDVNNPGTLLSSTIQNGLEAAALLPAAIIQTIQIQGSQANGQQATITTVSINPIDPAVGADGGWWQTLFPHFANATGVKFHDATHAPVTYTDPETGAAISVSGLGYSLPNGNLAPWMTSGASPIIAKKVRITAYFDYTEFAPGASSVITGSVQGKEEHIDLILTNAESGTYTNISSLNLGDPIPYGLAGYILTLESILQSEGTITLQETEISDACPLGNRLNLTGGLTAWASMAAQVQGVKYSDNGQTEITIGPAKHLGAVQFYQRMKTNIGPRDYLLLGVNPTNTNASSDNQVPPNVAMQAPSPGAKSFSFQKFLGSLVATQASPDSTHLDKGIYHNPNGDWGGTPAPSVSSSTPELIIAAGGTAYPFAQLDVTPKLKLQAAASYGASAVLDGYAAKLTLASSTQSAFLDAGEMNIVSGSNTADVQPALLTLGNGADSISANVSDIAGLGTAKFLSLTFCQDGVNYTAKFLMTTPVAA